MSITVNSNELKKLVNVMPRISKGGDDDSTCDIFTCNGNVYAGIQNKNFGLQIKLQNAQTHTDFLMSLPLSMMQKIISVNAGGTITIENKNHEDYHIDLNGTTIVFPKRTISENKYNFMRVTNPNEGVTNPNEGVTCDWEDLFHMTGLVQLVANDAYPMLHLVSNPDGTLSCNATDGRGCVHTNFPQSGNTKFSACISMEYNPIIRRMIAQLAAAPAQWGLSTTPGHLVFQQADYGISCWTPLITPRIKNETIQNVIDLTITNNICLLERTDIQEILQTLRRATVIQTDGDDYVTATWQHNNQLVLQCSNQKGHTSGSVILPLVDSVSIESHRFNSKFFYQFLLYICNQGSFKFECGRQPGRSKNHMIKFTSTSNSRKNIMILQSIQA